MKNKRFAIAAALALALGLAVVPALAAQFDGRLPLYPRGHAAPGMEIAAGALAQGVPYQQVTTDSVHLVDLWYKSNAPKSCTRVTATGKPAVQYKCPGGSIVIQVRGGTLISFVTAFPHF
ncbi:MAG TPA: hypothetical protein VID19_12990 [Candidatus Eremiobacteraceae bacterium]